MKYLAILLFLFATGPSWKVSDGDTIKNEKVRLRLYGIDCPEKDQPGGKEAKEFTLSWLECHPGLEITELSRDRYGRTIAWVIDGADTLNIDLLKNGHAWHYGYYTNNDPYLQSLEDHAKHTHMGLWEQENPVNPYQWRKRKNKKRK